MRSFSRTWVRLGLLGGVVAGGLAACGELNSVDIVITDGNDGLGGLGGLSGLGGFGGEAPVLGDPPSVVGVTPADDADDVGPKAKIVVEFSEALDESSITEDSVYVLDGDEKVPGTLSYSNGNVIFTPASPLSLNTTYTVHVTTDVHDTTDQVLTAAFSSTFVTRDGAFADEVLLRETGTWVRPSKPDAQGNVLVAWEEADGGGNSDIYAVFISPIGEVGEPMLLESLGGLSLGPEVAMSPEGDAIVAWSNIEVTDAPRTIWARRYIDGEWEAAEQRVESVMDATNKWDDGPFVGVSKGDFTVGWLRRWNDGAVYTSLEFTKAEGAGAWDTVPFGIDGGNTAQGWQVRSGGINLDFGPDGGGTIVYTYDDGAIVRGLRSAFYSPNTGSWSIGAVLRPSEDLAVLEYCGGCLPSVRRDASGGALLTWSERDTNTSEINLWASYYEKTNGWGAPMPVDQAAGNAFAYQGGIAGFGGGFAVSWKQDNQTIFSPLVSFFDVEEGTWSEPKLLSDGESNNYYSGPQLAADAHGNLVAAWSQGGDFDVPPTMFYARFDHLSGAWGMPAPLVQIDQAYDDAQLVALPSGPVYAFLHQAWTGYTGPDYPYLAVFE